MNVNHWEAILSLEENQPRSLGLELENLACHQADKIGLIYQDRQISYDELNRNSNRYANYFYKEGFQKGDVVVLLMENHPEYLMAVSGLSKLGVIVALVNTDIRGDTLTHDINICEAKAIIVELRLLDSFAEVVSTIRMKSPGHVFVIDNAGDTQAVPENMIDLTMLLKDSSDQNPPTTGTIWSDDCLVYMYTAGHSGLRKAVPVTHQRWLIKGHQFSFNHLNHDKVQYMCLPLYLNSGFFASYAGLIISGSTMVLRQRFSLRDFWSDIRAHGVNYIITVGEIVRYLYSQPAKPDDADNPLQIMVCVGTLADIVHPFRQRFGLEHVFEVFSMTEGIGTFVNQEEVANMCGNLNFNGVRQGEIVHYDFRQDKIKIGANGKAIKCSPGEVGLLLCEINKLNQFAGYLHDAEATEKMVLFDVFRQGDQYLNSGDLVKLHDKDYFSYVERLGDTYRWKGITVSAHQVADVIKKFYGGIEEVVVYGVNIPGLEGSCGMAAVKLLEDESLDWAKLTRHIKRRIPEHARPVFIRMANKMEGDQDSQPLKQTLREEGFDPGQVFDPVYFLDPRSQQYILLTQEIYAQILNQEVKI